MFDALATQGRQQARTGQSTKRATVSIWIERNGIGGGEQHFSGFTFNRRHHPLGEKMNRAWVQTEVVMLLEESHR